MQVGRWIKPNTLVHFRAEKHRRANSRNRHYQFGGAYVFSKKWSIEGSVGYTPNSIFIPQWRFKLSGERMMFENASQTFLNRGWFTLSAQYDRYKTLDTTVIKPGFRIAVNDNLSVHAQHINVIDENTKHLRVWGTRLDWNNASLPKMRFFAGLSSASETENATTVKTSARFLGLSYNMTQRVRVNVSYAREDRNDSYLRKILASSISVKF
ncbi:MAG: YaiO family outer membrane protein [Alphaproteobacteria bacterium]